MFADSLRFQHFFLIIFCKFFGFFARLFAFFWNWGSVRDGSRPEPDPIITSTLARARPEHRTIVTSFDYCRYSGCEFGVQEILVRRPPLSSPRTIVTPIPDPGTGQRDLLGVKRTIIPSFGGCRSGHWVRLYRTIIRFPDPGRSGPEQKNPEP